MGAGIYAFHTCTIGYFSILYVYSGLSYARFLHCTFSVIFENGSFFTYGEFVSKSDLELSDLMSSKASPGENEASFPWEAGKEGGRLLLIKTKKDY